jgi:SAM-dependent methyltransferase
MGSYLTMALAAPTPALDAYEAFAPYYDSFTASYDHDCWLANLEATALGLGLTGKRLLDVGCGTGKSFAPMARRGYEVVGCDISPAMLEVARARDPWGDVELVEADMRELPELGSYDLVTCLDDGLNYLLSEEELGSAFAGVAANLAPGGLFVFDVNTLATYRQTFATDSVVESEEMFFCWRGTGDPSAPPGELATALIDVFALEGDCWMRSASRHVQRHHPPAVVERQLRAAALALADVCGQVTGARLERPPDEARHSKLVYFARGS